MSVLYHTIALVLEYARTEGKEGRRGEKWRKVNTLGSLRTTTLDVALRGRLQAGVDPIEMSTFSWDKSKARSRNSFLIHLTVGFLAPQHGQCNQYSLGTGRARPSLFSFRLGAKP